MKKITLELSNAQHARLVEIAGMYKVAPELLAKAQLCGSWDTFDRATFEETWPHVLETYGKRGVANSRGTERFEREVPPAEAEKPQPVEVRFATPKPRRDPRDIALEVVWRQFTGLRRASILEQIEAALCENTPEERDAILATNAASTVPKDDEEPDDEGEDWKRD